jgi:formylglycine-generating enzyme
VRVRFAAVVVACAFAVACPGEESSGPAPSAVVSQVVGPSGGTVTSPSGASVEIPADALEKSVSIRISELSGEGPELPPGRSRVSPIFAFEPHGLEFRRDVIVTLPHSAGSAEVGMVRAAVGSDFGTIAVSSVTSSTVSAQTTSFSFFAATIEENGAGGAPGDGGLGDGGAPDGSAGADTSTPDGSVSVPPSCAASGPGLDDCGPGGDESCCVSLLVPGGSFYRSYDGVTDNDPSESFLTRDAPATVSTFRLDRFEVTRARYERFLQTWNAGWRPAPGDGKHVHLNGGAGLVDINGGFETGWVSDVIIDSYLPKPDAGVLDAGPGAAGNYPVGSVSYFTAVAFCIWDGGFLPSEAEWNYAAAGGAEQRVYPWSSPPTSSAIDCSHANAWANGYTDYCLPGPGGGRSDVVGSRSPKGDGRWGHADLGGNVEEWVLDHTTAYTTPCVDCVYSKLPRDDLYPPWIFAVRGGFHSEVCYVGQKWFRSTPGAAYIGFRCARSP